MKKWLLTTALTAVIGISHAQSEISTFFSELKTFSADFTQSVKQDGNLVQQSAGTLQLKKPLKFRWDYQSPEPMQLVSDGKKFYHYDIDLAQVTVKPTAEIAGSALTTLMSDKEQLDDVFNIQSFAAPALKKRFPQQAETWLQTADIFYALKPKSKNDDDAQANEVIIGLSADKKLRVFYAKDAYGENTFLFSNPKQNQSIRDKVFRFKAPKGVDVLGE